MTKKSLTLFCREFI